MIYKILHRQLKIDLYLETKLIEPFICFLNVLRKAEENNKSFQFLDPALLSTSLDNNTDQIKNMATFVLI
jgi:hypothetical protein